MDVWQDVTDNWSELCVAMGCTRIEVPGAVVHAYPIYRSGPFYNSAFVRNPKSFSIERVGTVFAERKLPFVITFPSLKPYARLGKLLRERDYSPAPAWSLMTQKELIDKSNPEVSVYEIDSPELEDWFGLQDVFSHVVSSRVRRWEMIEKIAKKQPAKFLIANFHGNLVGAGLLFLKGHVASIHMIATLAAFRRRHVATTVTLEAVRRARNEHAGLIWLRTRRGGTGQKVYSSIGFEVYSDILSYTKTPEYEDTNLPPKWI
jgi:ribosomal protein S18 acetylase RimI-like enzyme